ncbi:MrcB family domain-containing protein [Alicyclobacillus fastidiosus]|uniref:MrcB family domain-containing protein n=1 Tax=Alicyclobacillus fastidiosus TaxID=392011 RepID=UPI0024E11531|nr:DUF3578 domain-containing protein [Alicyclobacillus fastidiosus]
METLFNRYYAARQAAGAADRTLEDYVKHMRWLRSFLALEYSGLDTVVPNREVIRAWISHMITVQKLKPSTINIRLRTVKAMFNWAVSEGLLTETPFDNVSLLRVPEEEFQVITKAQERRLLEQCDLQTLTGLRDALMISFLLDTGVRIGACTRIYAHEVDLANRSVLVLNEYPSASLTSGQPPLRQFVSTTTANHVRALIDTRQYTVKGSTGAGNWAAIPWICIFDKDITDSATHGIYICYLFRADMSGVYLSLNQGWTYYKEKHPRKISDARNEIRSVTLAWREVLTSNLNDFDTTEIDLHHTGNLAEGYELGHICGKFYDSSRVPEDFVLFADLNAMIGVYRELKGHMEDVQDLSATNEDILVSRAVSEDVDDTKFQQRVSTAQPKYTSSPQDKKEPRMSRGRKTWQRDVGIARGR